VGAAEKGHLHVLQYLHVNGCRWDASACEGAARSGHLEVLEYLNMSGCPRFVNESDSEDY
jgi:hypothetical protein